MDSITRSASTSTVDITSSDPWAHSPVAALACVLHAADRALATDQFFPDPDDAGELERSIDIVREVLGMGIGAEKLLAGR